MTQADCIPYQCGAPDGTVAGITRLDCAQAGFTGVRTCLDPACSPYALCSGFGPGQAPLPSMPVLTPFNITAPLPDLVGALAPSTAPPPAGLWCNVNGWISAHPVLSIAALVIVGAVLWPKAGR